MLRDCISQPIKKPGNVTLWHAGGCRGRSRDGILIDSDEEPTAAIVGERRNCFSVVLWLARVALVLDEPSFRNSDEFFKV
jgi:hypothetical protein